MSSFTDQLFHILSRPLARQGEKPNFLICGAPRSGTTTLADLLGKHPEVYLCPTKEPQFFSAYFNNPVSWYKRQFTPSEGVKAVGETSTNYIYRKNVPERIYEFNPEMKLIFILRDPVQRAYSHYKREIQTHGINERFLKLLKQSDHYIKPGLYYSHLERFRRHFPESQIKLLLFEDFVNNQVEVLEKVANFLSLESDFFDLGPSKQANPSRYPRSIGVQKLIYRLFGQRDREPISLRYLRGALRLILTKINEFNCSKQSFPELSHQEIDYLKGIYRPEVKGINQYIQEKVTDYWDF